MYRNTFSHSQSSKKTTRAQIIGRYAKVVLRLISYLTYLHMIVKEIMISKWAAIALFRAYLSDAFHSGLNTSSTYILSILFKAPIQRIGALKSIPITLRYIYSVPKKSVHFLMFNISKISRRFFCKFSMVSPKYRIYRSKIKPTPYWPEIFALYGNT